MFASSPSTPGSSRWHAGPAACRAISRSQQAQSQIEDYKPDFVDWVERELQELSDALLQRPRAAISARRKIDGMYRLCCQLRDTGTTMGLALLTFVSDNLCRVLEAIKNGAPYDPAMIECHIDALALARKEPYRKHQVRISSRT